MSKIKIVNAAVTAMLNASLLLSGNVDNTALTIKANTSIEQNIEVTQMNFDEDIKLTNIDTRYVIDKDIKYNTLEETQEKLNNNVGKTSEIYGLTNVLHLKTLETVIKEVIDGDYGYGEERKLRLEAEGYVYLNIQKEINKLMPKVKANNNIDEVDEPIVVVKNNSTIEAHPHKTFKSYMSWTALSKGSPQGKLCAKAKKDPSTSILMIDGRYLVALGFAYANQIGEEIDIIMESGQVIPVIVGDWKAKEHTDKWSSASTNNGSIIEFIVSSNKDAAKATGGSGSYNGIFPGKVKEFKK